jgi:hypothetical protein
MIRNLRTWSKYPRIDQLVIDRAERAGAFGERPCRRRIDAARVHGYRDHRAPGIFLEPRHQERGVESAGESQQDGLSALE